MNPHNLKVEISGLAYGGAFIGRVISGAPQHSGKKAFVRGCLPGEVVEIEIEKEHANFIEGRLLTILEGSPHRIEPPCPFYGTCGGCDLQHIPIIEQRKIKARMIEDALRFQGGFEIQVQLEGADLPDYGYRRRVAFHIAPDGKIGFYKHGTNALVEIDRCLILMQELNLALTNYGPAISKYGTLFADLILEKESLIWVALRAREKASIEAVQDALSELKLVIPNLRVYFNEKPLFQQQDFKELQSAHPVGRFSQVNAVGNEVLKRTVTVLSKSDSVTELYAGAGNFSLPLAELGKKVQAIEIDPELVRAGNELSLQSGFGDLIKFYQISCERFIKDHKVSAEIVLDPPRSGAKEVVRLLRPESTSRIIYISCNLPSLVRDLKILSCQGYKLEQVKMIDMFAQTHHVETVSVLSS